VNQIFAHTITAALACCSIIYELLFAQSLSVAIGDSALRYNLTIGTYLAALGAGSLWHYARGQKWSFERLMRIEALLSVIGFVGPIAVFVALGVTSRVADHQTSPVVLLLSHILVVVVGVLSGIELPLLISLHNKHAGASAPATLAADYVGSFVGAVLFPLVLLRTLDLFAIAAACALLNALCGLLIAVRWRRHSPAWAFLFLLLGAPLGLALVYQTTIADRIADMAFSAPSLLLTSAARP